MIFPVEISQVQPLFSRHEVMLWLLTFATHVVLLAARRTAQAPGSRTGEKSPKHKKSSKTGQHDDFFFWMFDSLKIIMSTS